MRLGEGGNYLLWWSLPTIQAAPPRVTDPNEPTRKACAWCGEEISVNPPCCDKRREMTHVGEHPVYEPEGEE